jgi:predicted RNA-binding protein YlqC (UPF0109 family)
MSGQNQASITHHETALVTTLTESDLPRFIGKSGSGIKDHIIRPSWRLYNHYAKTNEIDAGSEQLRVLASFKDGAFTVQIECNTDPMLKFVQRSLSKYVESLTKKTEKRASPFHYLHFYTSEEHHRIAKFIGRGGNNIKSLTSALSALIVESECDLERDQLSVSIKPFHTEKTDSLDYLKDKTFSFVNEAGGVDKSSITEDGPYIFLVVKVKKTLTDKSEGELYSLFEDTVVDYFKPQETHNPEIEAEIEAALGGGW